MTQIQNITPESDPDVWALLQPPEENSSEAKNDEEDKKAAPSQDCSSQNSWG